MTVLHFQMSQNLQTEVTDYNNCKLRMWLVWCEQTTNHSKSRDLCIFDQFTPNMILEPLLSYSESFIWPIHTKHDHWAVTELLWEFHFHIITQSTNKQTDATENRTSPAVVTLWKISTNWRKFNLRQTMCHRKMAASDLTMSSSMPLSVFSKDFCSSSSFIFICR